MTIQGEQIRELQANEINLVSGGADDIKAQAEQAAMLMSMVSSIIKSIGESLAHTARNV
jgi:hypothetical protein